MGTTASAVVHTLTAEPVEASGTSEISWVFAECATLVGLEACANDEALTGTCLGSLGVVDGFSLGVDWGVPLRSLDLARLPANSVLGCRKFCLNEATFPLGV